VGAANEFTELALTRTELDPIGAWHQIAKLLPPEYGELANVHKQIQTQFGNAKITTADELLRFLFAYVQSNLPLRHTVAAIEAAGGPRLSAMRLHMKMRHAAPYLHALLGRLVPERELFAAPGREGSFRGLDFVLVDAAGVIGTGSTCTPARLHAAMRLADLRVPSAVLTDRTERDALRRFMWSEGQVAVVHAANASPGSIERLRAQGADVLVTLDPANPDAALPLTERGGAAFPLAERLAELDDVAVEWPVLLTVQDPAQPERTTIIEGRVIARRARGGSFGPERTGKYTVPIDFDAVAMPEASPAAVCVFTTVSKASLPADALLDANDLAARIGAATNGWREPAGQNRLSNQREDTTLAWLYAKMLLGILARRADAARAA